jgi:hypothetical protein
MRRVAERLTRAAFMRAKGSPQTAGRLLGTDNHAASTLAKLYAPELLKTNRRPDITAEQLARLHRKGWSQERIAAHLQAGESTIARRFRRASIGTLLKTRPELPDSAFVELRDQGFKHREIADQLEVSMDHLPGENTLCPTYQQHAPSPDYSSGPDWYDAFCREWPVARDHEQLRAQVSLALQGVAVPSREVMATWHPDSGIFHGIANWARTALAYMNARSNPGVTPTLPQREEMPAALVEARAPLLAAIDKPAKQKRTRKAPVASIAER